ncbi:MAG: hypothetical protein QXX17_07315 [Conexivisphaerales archaeon]
MLAEEKKRKVHFNVTIPEELLSEMKKHPEVNWSRVAARAFERHIWAENLLKDIEEPGITDEEAAKRVIETRRRMRTKEV